MVTSLSKDTSLVKFSWRPIGSFYVKLLRPSSHIHGTRYAASRRQNFGCPCTVLQSLVTLLQVKAQPHEGACTCNDGNCTAAYMGDGGDCPGWLLGGRDCLTEHRGRRLGRRRKRRSPGAGQDVRKSYKRLVSSPFCHYSSVLSPRDALHSARSLPSCGVCLSVPMSHAGSLIILVFAPIPNSKGNPSAGALNTRGWENLRFSTEFAVYLGNSTR